MPRMALHMTQTKYGDEDALVRVTIGGILVRDVRVAATDKPDVFMFTDVWPAGAKTVVTLALLNDKWDGDGKDRNAFLKRVEMDGADLGITRNMYSADPVSFEVALAAQAPVPAPIVVPPKPPAPTPPAKDSEKLDTILDKLRAGEDRLSQIEALIKTPARDENVFTVEVTEAEFLAVLRARKPAAV